jgi:nitrogen fixation/metabolism regulation signal transduction histidine kinase
VRVDRALESGLTLADSSLKYLLNDTTNKATQLAVGLSDTPGNLSMALNRAAEQANVFEATLFTPTGGVLAVAGTGGSRATPEPPPPEALRLARLQQPYKKIEETGEGSLALRVVVPVNTDDAANPLKLLQVIEPVPKALAQEAERVRSGVRDYRELTLLRQGLKQLYQLTLLLTLLLALTTALGLAVILSEQFAAPLGLLAEGTRAVAQGDFTRRPPVVSRDELGVLTESFNTMTEQLAEAHGKTEDSRRATETARAYLDSILGNLSSGVLAFDERHRLRTVNPSAAVILQQPLAELIGMPLADWGKRLPALASFAELVAEGFRGGRDGQWQREAELGVANLTRTLLMRGTPLPGTPVAAGFIVVFDDVSELMQAQRDAAWAEVARRLAHEIKNPLTPIQLSAERLAVKLAAKLEGPDQDTLKRGTQTIVSQVAAMKNMVDDFAIYARQPRPGQLQQVDLAALLLDVLGLYDNLRPHVALSLPEAPVMVQGEPTRLRQVFHNLLSNAVDAQVDVAEPHFAIALAASGNEATLTFADAGPGFAADVLEHAFEPYVTTKAKGTGLGLAIVKKIIDEHGGRVVLDNAQPTGARVTLHFPTLPTAKPAAAAA